MFSTLQECGYDMIAVNAALGKPARALAAAATVSANRLRWVSKFRYGRGPSRLRGLAAKRSLGETPVDFLIMIGATFDPPRMGEVPFAIYADWNMALSAEEAAANPAHRRLSPAEFTSLDRRHRARYQAASVIFTISERLRQSFIEHYGIHPDRVVTVYAGPNLDAPLIEETRRSRVASTTPTLLFIAKEFRRKGGDTVVKALTLIQQKLPVRLLFAGAQELPAELRGLPGVEHLGLLDKGNPEQLRQLMDAYAQADVLVLPSRRDPFPTVIREAMFLGVPCVASDIWAIPEMIVDGETGFLVKPGDAETLAKRCLTLLENRSERERMAAAGLRRAEALFSWKAVGEAMSRSVQEVLASRPSARPEIADANVRREFVG